MKYTTTMAFIMLNIAISTSHALETEEQTAEQEIVSYCQQQAELAEIQQPQEKALYIDDCVKSFTSQYQVEPVTE